MLKRLWQDQGGAVVTPEIVLIATVLIIGMMVGLKSVRDAVVTEMADLAQGVSNIDQSFSYSGVDGHSGGQAGAFYYDGLDFCDTAGDADWDGTLATEPRGSKGVNVAMPVIFTFGGEQAP
jgi:hypothetical protein